MALRPRFDINREFVAALSFDFLGVSYKLNDPFPKAVTTARKLEQMYETRRINFAPAVTTPAPDPTDPVKIETGGGGWYTITAPWLEAPIKVQGLEAAEAEAARIREEGPPEGWTASE